MGFVPFMNAVFQEETDESHANERNFWPEAAKLSMKSSIMDNTQDQGKAECPDCLEACDDSKS